MEIKSLLNNSLNFTAKKPKLSQEDLTRILTPFKDSITPVNDIKAKTGIPIAVINKWFLDNFNMSVAKLYKKLKDDKLRTELINYRKNGKSYSEIANLLGQKKRWVDKKMFNLKATYSRKTRKELMEENIPWMIKAGYTVERIHHALQIGVNTIYKWIKETENMNITKYRHDNKIDIWRELDSTKSKFKQEFISFFEKGGTLTEASKHFGLSKSGVFHWMKVFNIKSAKQKAKENLKEHLQERINNNCKTADIAKEFGVSVSTVSREIKKLSKKSEKSITSSDIL